MFRRRKHHSLMGMDVNFGNMDAGDLKTVVKVVAMGVIAYQATKFIVREIMD